MTPDQLRAAGFTPLSEGDSLDAWNVKPWHKGHWTIKDGLINYDGKAERQVRRQFAVDQKQLRRLRDVRRMAAAREAKDEAHADRPLQRRLPDGGGQPKRVTRPHLDAGDSGLMFRGTSSARPTSGARNSAPAKSTATAPIRKCRRRFAARAFQSKTPTGPRANGTSS